MNTQIENPFQGKNINLNTILGVASFLVLFAGIVANYASVKFQQDQTTDWQRRHEELHDQLKAERIARNAAIDVRIDATNGHEYRIAQNEKGLEGTEARLNRMAESYGNQFGEIRTQMNQIAIQLALANDSLKRLEQIDRRNSREFVQPQALQGK